MTDRLSLACAWSSGHADCRFSRCCRFGFRLVHLLLLCGLPFGSAKQFACGWVRPNGGFIKLSKRGNWLLGILIGMSKINHVLFNRFKMWTKKCTLVVYCALELLNLGHGLVA